MADILKEKIERKWRWKKKLKDKISGKNKLNYSTSEIFCKNCFGNTHW